MPALTRGADVVARTLAEAGVGRLFTLSGNHVMPIFDAVLGTGIDLVHVRHEAAAVHMADAYARVTGRCGVALVTGGPGHANAVGALYTAAAAEAPVLLLSGHAPLSQIGRGAFQEMRQADLAEPVAKAAWTVSSAAALRPDLLRAFDLARSGRPGPVHLSLPVDILDAEGIAGEGRAVVPEAGSRGLDDGEIAELRRVMNAAARPVVLVGPLLCQPWASRRMAEIRERLAVPVVGMESPRGLADPSLGAFAELLRRADLIVLLGKPHDFTLGFAGAGRVDPACRFAVVDPDPAMIARAVREHGDRVAFSAVADALPSAERIAAEVRGDEGQETGWRAAVREAIAYRPPEWVAATSRPGERVHPLDLCRAVAEVMAEDPRSVFVCDGGEIGQWAQAVVGARRRVVNGVAGAIGAAVPFAIGARAADPDAPVIALSGDGAVGFHIMEFDTAIRHRLPFVMVVGNDATWNAEHQIQLRDYGPERAHGCTLLPTRYDRVVEALGGHGEFVTEPAELAPALRRALRSGQPACVNVMIERCAAPTIRRS